MKVYSGIPATARSEAGEAIVRAPHRSDAGEHLAAILSDFRDRHVPVTALNVMSRALDTGLGEKMAVQLAGLVENMTADLRSERRAA